MERVYSRGHGERTRDQTSWQLSTARVCSVLSSFPTFTSARAAAKPNSLLDFLRYHDAETIYLVGDIVDGWQLRAGWYWPQPHNDVVQKLLRKARKGARMIYLPGNHDEFLRDYYGTHFGGIEVKETAIHEAADGRRYLVVHGDVFDLVVKHARWLALARRQGLRSRHLRQPLLQRGAPAARLFLLVAVAMGEAQGQERGELYRRLRADAGRRGAAAAASTASSAATSITPRSTRSSASATSIAATGSRAARQSPSTRTADSRSSPGPRLTPCVRFSRRRSSGWRKNEKSRRERCRCRSFRPGTGCRLEPSFRGTKAPSATCWSSGGANQRSVTHHFARETAGHAFS